MTAYVWAIAAIVMCAIVGFTEVQKAKRRAKNGIAVDWMGGERPIAPPTNPALEREVAELRERVKVLERIATDGRQTNLLSAEIESLREK